MILKILFRYTKKQSKQIACLISKFLWNFFLWKIFIICKFNFSLNFPKSEKNLSNSSGVGLGRSGKETLLKFSRWWNFNFIFDLSWIWFNWKTNLIKFEKIYFIFCKKNNGWESNSILWDFWTKKTAKKENHLMHVETEPNSMKFFEPKNCMRKKIFFWFGWNWIWFFEVFEPKTPLKKNFLFLPWVGIELESSMS